MIVASQLQQRNVKEVPESLISLISDKCAKFQEMSLPSQIYGAIQHLGLIEELSYYLICIL